ncbi:MAG: NAD(P)-binding domain-containing protein [Acidobacteriota bacterium]
MEKLPVVSPDGTTAAPGVRIVGDLTGIPLLKFSSDSGARAVRSILAEPDFHRSRGDEPETLDLAIIGAGVSGISAAIEAGGAGLRYRIFEASEPFSTIVNFPKGKPIYTYPTDMKPAGGLQFATRVKEDLLRELEAQRREAGVEVTRARIERVEGKDGGLLLRDESGRVLARARRVIVAIGRSGNHRKLGVPGEELDKVYNRLHDPGDFSGKQALVVGGGDSALETVIALAGCGSHVTLSYRKTEFARPKPENIAKLRMLERDPAAPVMVEEPTSERVTTSAGPFARTADMPPGSVRLALGTQVVRIGPGEAVLRDSAGEERVLENDVVFSMIGREAPLEFFRRSRIPIRGELTRRNLLMFATFMLFCLFLYNWKAGGDLNRWFREHEYFPYNMPAILEQAGGSLAAAVANPKTPLGTFAVSLGTPGFYYSLAYCVLVILFGIRRIRRRPTPYVRRQTLVLAAIQVLPLFVLPQLLLPWAGHNGFFDHGLAATVADNLFPAVNAGPGREYWRAYGLILAWPLFIWNVFTAQPLWWWLAISFAQTFALIPLIIRYWGKGAYCGWICSCGALAETLGDAHRHKMPHGPFWNRANMVGQGILVAALLLLAARALSWAWPGTAVGRWAASQYAGLLTGWAPLGVQLNYYHVADIFLAGIVGVGCYFWFSGRVWCRFACPLAALMHVYARFSSFRIFPEKSKCISCNLCTSVCHQGIDIMNFANKGVPMADPECVRCSACVQDCPTGTLSFGRFTGAGVPQLDRVPASLVQIRESAPSPGNISR